MGIMGGICISLLVGIGLFYSRIAQPDQPAIVSAVQPEVVAQFPTATASPQPDHPLDQAELALNSGYPEQVRDLLYPMIEQWTANEDLIRGYRLLGEAELAQGHPQLAVPYFEKLYFYEPTAENLFMLATVYDAGGDNRNALNRYQELAKWDDLPIEVDIEFVNMRVYQISRALGTPLPTLTSLP
jgi:hypothetical protein